MTPFLTEATPTSTVFQLRSAVAAMRTLADQEAFSRTIAIERRRTERTNIPFLLMLLSARRAHGSLRTEAMLESVANALLPVTRSTDTVGWYTHQKTIGVVFTGLSGNKKNTALNAILSRLGNMLATTLSGDSSEIDISLHFYPDEWHGDEPTDPQDTALYPEVRTSGNGNRLKGVLKRGIDILGSIFLLVLFSPLIILIAAAIKFTSVGPVLYRQRRVGQLGRHFTMLKFRTMRVDTDHTPHKEYAQQFIANAVKHEGGDATRRTPVYKLTNDTRITRIGMLLRKVSLDELPQLLNVLAGQMSLVGPRPAIPYEFEVYQTWHRRRVFNVKPGITGLWQVTSRSRVRFDDMVRLDLQYADSWSPWLDLKILMRTPFVMVRGDGAY